MRETGWRPVKCPFHIDRQASASVNLERGAFRCHGCGVKGDAIGLVMDREGMDYSTAIEFAKGMGVEVDSGTPVREARQVMSKWRDTLFA